MKKSLSVLVTAAVLMAGAAHAEQNSKDVSAVLAVTGKAFIPESVCSVELSPTSISLESTIEDLRPQGTTVLPTDIVNLSVIGDNDCNTLISGGKIAYRFVGVADSKTGEVLANADTSEGAATGVGVGIYSIYGKPIALNADKVDITTDKFGLRLVSLDQSEPATMGNVSSTLTVQIERL
ncbi:MULTISPECIES: fimbrial protein [Atlantibacter]|uniref:fimbrial protein n=1 Tax=Atlantibacter TaxID=1903434 RepID=UPI0019332253|nr:MULTISPECIES: fimbrial protein [Atlantibacter]MBL7637101.1 type 1 fimbrial protein [Atlantibacter hermannii]MBL7674048.1 type 1 fimbrial protein [Atlantibacter hermannii]MCZ7834726.1 type 1 fimbrial protein [Atlantibacter hermannii]